MKSNIYPQGKLVCPVCSKEFEANDDTRYIIAGGFTCSWKCFLVEAKKRNEEKRKQEADQPKRRGRQSIKARL